MNPPSNPEECQTKLKDEIFMSFTGKPQLCTTQWVSPCFQTLMSVELVADTRFLITGHISFYSGLTPLQKHKENQDSHCSMTAQSHIAKTNSIKSMVTETHGMHTHVYTKSFMQKNGGMLPPLSLTHDPIFWFQTIKDHCSDQYSPTGLCPIVCCSLLSPKHV